MRVLFVQGAGERAGAEGVLLTLATHLPRVGVEPVVAVLAGGPFVDELEGAGLRVVRMPPVPRARDVRKWSGVVHSLAAVATDVGADVIQAGGEKMSIFAGRAARLARIKSVFRLQDAPLRDVPATGVQVAMAATPHDAVVVPTRWMAQAFQRWLRIHARVIPHGIDHRTLPSEPLDVRPFLGWPPDSVVVGHFGRLQRWKGTEEFLEAAAFVAGNRPEVRFVVVGGALYGLERAYARRLPALAAELGLGDRIRFLGHRSDALAIMAACDVVVHCSIRPEPFGMVVLEAMALGRAVIASRAGGPDEIIDDGRTGILVRPRRPEELALALDRLVASRAERAALGAAAAEETRRRYTAERMARDYATLYRSLVPAGLRNGT